MDTAELVELVTKNHKVVVDRFAKADQTDVHMSEVKSQLAEIEQKMARGFGSLRGVTGSETKSWGDQIVNSPSFQGFIDGAATSARIEVKTVSTVGSGSTFAGPMIAPDYRQDVVGLPQRRMTIRQLLAPGQTNGNLVYYPKMTARQSNAAPVAESGAKPQSDFALTQASAPVRTIAHYMQTTRQAFDDAPALQSLIDSELRYGLAITEEAELLNGDGTGQHLLGLLPQASAYSAAFAVSGETLIDRLALAMLQVDLALVPATGFVINPTDWMKAKMLKDADGKYILGPPSSSAPAVLWGLPVVPTPAMAAGSFLCGAFDAACQIFDRMSVEVLISTEHGSNFTNNEITIRCEERLAMAVKRPPALVTGTLP
jgi:HK97 family phage major capsid protein